MAKATRITLGLLTLLTAIFIILGALLPTFVARVGSADNTVGLFKTCLKKDDSSTFGGVSLNTEGRSLHNFMGLKCMDNSKADKAFGTSSSIKESAKGLVGNDSHTFKPRPTAEKVSAGFLCTAGVITALIGFFTLFPSMSIFAYTYMISPIVLHVIGMSLAIWTGIERFKSMGANSTVSNRVPGAGLILQIVSLLMLIVLAGMWTMPSARKTSVSKYGA